MLDKKNEITVMLESVSKSRRWLVILVIKCLLLWERVRSLFSDNTPSGGATA